MNLDADPPLFNHHAQLNRYNNESSSEEESELYCVKLIHSFMKWIKMKSVVFHVSVLEI